MNFHDNPVHKVQLQKHLGLFLDPKLSFHEHTQCILIKTCKIIGLIRNLQSIIPRAALLTIYKSFLRPHLDYGGVIYDCTCNKSFQNNSELVQYNAALAITGAIRGSSIENLYQKLDLELLKPQRRYRKLCLFFKIIKINIPPTSLIYFPGSYQHGLPEIITTSLCLMFNMNTSETLFFHPLLLRGISSTIIFKIWDWLVLLKNKSLNL